MLTVCIIAKNEGLNIEECLVPFSSLTDSFVVVDTGSSDDTKDRALSKGAKVYDFVLENDFSSARNFALEQVKSEWVMMVDADHRMGTEDLRKLKDFLERNDDFDVADLQCEFDGSYAYLPRLWKTSLGLRYKYPVHEYLEVPADLRRTQLDLVVRDPLPRNHVESRKYYIQIMEAYVKKHPEDHRMLYYLISDNRFLRRYKKVVEWGEKYLASNPLNDNQVARVFNHLGYALWKLGLLKQAELAFQHATEFDASLVDSYLLAGDMKFSEANFSDALEWYKHAENCEFKGFKPYHLKPEKYTFEPKRKLALTLHKLGKAEEGLSYLREALALKPHDKELHSLLKTMTQPS